MEPTDAECCGGGVLARPSWRWNSDTMLCEDTTPDGSGATPDLPIRKSLPGAYYRRIEPLPRAFGTKSRQRLDLAVPKPKSPHLDHVEAPCAPSLPMWW